MLSRVQFVQLCMNNVRVKHVVSLVRAAAAAATAEMGDSAPPVHILDAYSMAGEGHSTNSVNVWPDSVNN
jgi:hypothetical protein